MISLVLSAVLALSPRLTLNASSILCIANSSHPGSAGNKHGFEDGSVVLTQDGALHVLVSELFDDPKSVKMRLAHWTSTVAGKWTRVSTLVLDGEPMVSTANCSRYHNDAALWSPSAYFDGDAWSFTFVGYDCGSAPNTEGVIKLALSTQRGPGGIAGPYVSYGGAPASNASVLLSRFSSNGTRVGQPWEQRQGDDSFAAFRPPEQGPLLAFYGSSNYGAPWQVGLARSASGAISGPWERLPDTNPLDLTGGRTENPVVLTVQPPSAGGVTPPVLLMIHDWVNPSTPNTGYFGFSWSADGYNWAPSTKVPVPGGVRAPMGLLPAVSTSGAGGPTQLTMWFNRADRFYALYEAQLALEWV